MTLILKRYFKKSTRLPIAFKNVSVCISMPVHIHVILVHYLVTAQIKVLNKVLLCHDYEAPLRILESVKRLQNTISILSEEYI